MVSQLNADRTAQAPGIDAHVHVWDTARLTYSWLRDAPLLDRPRLPIDLTVETGERVVFVQASADDGAAEAAWVQSLSAGWPSLAGIVAFAPVEETTLAETLDELSTLPLVVGVRRLLQDEEAGFIASKELVTGLRMLADRHIPFDACVRWHQLQELVSTVELVPESSVVLDHLGKPPVAAGLSSEAGRQWLHALQQLAKLPRVTVKLSGLAPEADPNRDVIEQVVPFLDVALDVFGAERCMYGSDWPVSAATPHRLSNRVWRETVASRVSRESDRWYVLEGTAAAFYSIDASPRPGSTAIAHE